MGNSLVYNVLKAYSWNGTASMCLWGRVQGEILKVASKPEHPPILYSSPKDVLSMVSMNKTLDRTNDEYW